MKGLLIINGKECTKIGISQHESERLRKDSEDSDNTGIADELFGQEANDHVINVHNRNSILINN